MAEPIVKPLTRDQLAKFLPDNDAIRRFEKLFQTVGVDNPQSFEVIFRQIQEISIDSNSAIGAANQANAVAAMLAQISEFLSTAPPAQIGTLGEQQADRAKITGGTIDGTTIGATTPAAATATVLTSTGATVVGTLLNISAAGAGQIQFPATQNPSANANTLDDYKESTWTPTLTSTTPGNLAVTYATRVGDYTKIGRQVFVTFVINTSAFTWTTATGDLILTGLPFASAGVSQISGCLDWAGITKAGYTQLSPVVVNGATQLLVLASGSGLARSTVKITEMPSAGTVFLSGQISYFV
jgi:hypothetical protein